MIIRATKDDIEHFAHHGITHLVYVDTAHGDYTPGDIVGKYRSEESAKRLTRNKRFVKIISIQALIESKQYQTTPPPDARKRQKRWKKKEDQGVLEFSDVQCR